MEVDLQGRTTTATKSKETRKKKFRERLIVIFKGFVQKCILFSLYCAVKFKIGNCSLSNQLEILIKMLANISSF